MFGRLFTMGVCRLSSHYRCLTRNTAAAKLPPLCNQKYQRSYATTKRLASEQATLNPEIPASALLGEGVPSSVSRAKSLLRGRRRILVLTGAGISTESGIPDYRSPNRPPHKPTSHQQFMESHKTRQRYWCRSMVGYEQLAHCHPNLGHYALGYLENQLQRSVGIITQNVDMLHERAGSATPVHLHGTIEHVRCMSCGYISSRPEYQAKLKRLNASFWPSASEAQDADTSSAASRRSQPTVQPDGTITIPIHMRPDADSDSGTRTDFSDFLVPSCDQCTDGVGNFTEHFRLQGKDLNSYLSHSNPEFSAGIIKPHLVFFGANVAAGVHEQADKLLAEADAMLVVGTSLTVWSAFRLLMRCIDKLPKLQPTSSPSSSSALTVLETSRLLSQQLQAQREGADSALLLESGSGGTTIVPVDSHVPIVLINQGPTRFDSFLPSISSASCVKIESTLASQALEELFDIPLHIRRQHRERMAKDNGTEYTPLEESVFTLPTDQAHRGITLLPTQNIE